MDLELKNAWAEWLASQPWSYFITVTFRDALPRHRAGSTLNAISKSLEVFQFHRVFLGMEQHASTYLHCHGLVCNRLRNHRPISAPLASVVWERLFDTYGFSRVEVVRDAVDASKYVTKYCVKGLADYLVV